MSNSVFIVSDWHLNHDNVWAKFKRRDQITPLRPFTSREEALQVLITKHNAKVGKDDKVYILGDVVINKKWLPLVAEFNGHKTLIAGNHDIFNTKEYVKYFDNIRAVRVFADMILSHIPLKQECVTARFGTNVHGHMHGNYIDHVSYLCVCVEHTGYEPLSLEECRERIKLNKESFANTGHVIDWSERCLKQS